MILNMQQTIMYFYTSASCVFNNYEWYMAMKKKY